MMMPERIYMVARWFPLKFPDGLRARMHIYGAFYSRELARAWARAENRRLSESSFTKRNPDGTLVSPCHVISYKMRDAIGSEGRGVVCWSKIDNPGDFSP